MRFIKSLGLLFLVGFLMNCNLFFVESSTTNSLISTTANFEDFFEIFVDLIEDDIGYKISFVFNQNYNLTLIKKVGFFVGKDEIVDLNKETAILILEQTYNYEETIDFFVNNLSIDEYNDNYLFLPFIVIDDKSSESVVFGEQKTSNLYELSLSNNGNISRKIKALVEEKYFSTINIIADLTNYQIESLSNIYQATISTDYMEVTIQIIFSDECFLDELEEVFLNGKKVDDANYYLVGNELIITTPDPNWSSQY